MRKKNILTALSFVGVAAIAYAAGAAAAKKGVMTSATEMVWDDYAPGAPLKVAKLWGDRAKGEYGMLLKLPAGFEAGMHSHSADYHAVLVSGTWTHTFTDGTAKEMGPGSYVFQPGKADHNDACKAGADCILFVHQHAKGDFKPAKPAPAVKEK